MIKNKEKQIDVKWDLVNKGNWNFRNKNLTPLYTKPITVVTLDNDIFVWQHCDIMALIKGYHEADKLAIKMIKEGNAGSVTNAEISLLEKLKEFIRELEQDDKFIQDSIFLKDGQKELLL